MSEQPIVIPDYNDAYSMTMRKHRVNTKFKTCMELRSILDRIGLKNLFKNGNLEQTQLIPAVIKALSEANLVNEFCQIVTGEKDTKFEDCEFGEITWVVNDFFTAYWWQMPPSWRKAAKQGIGLLQALGMSYLPAKPEEKPEPEK